MTGYYLPGSPRSGFEVTTEASIMKTMFDDGDELEG